MTDLWSLTVAFKNGNNQLRLLYVGKDKAGAAYDAVKRPKQAAADFDRGLPAASYDPDVEIEDSYGTTATVDRDSVMLHWVTNLGEQSEGQKAEGLLIEHAKASFMRRVAADPMLKGMPPAQPAFKLNG